MLCQSSHHTHINPDNLSITDLNISGMRISVEEPIIHYLLNIVIYKFASNFFQVISIFEQLILLINTATINIFHDQLMNGRILLIQNRCLNKIDIFISSGKFFDIRCFGQEIHLISCH